MMKRALKAAGIFVATLALGLSLTLSPVATQAGQLVFGSSSGTAQVIKSTSNALWVSIQGASLFPDGTVGAPSIAFASEPTTGIYRRAVNTITFSILNSNFLDLNNANGYLEVGSGTKFAWSTTTDATAARDIVLWRSAAKTLTIDTDGAAGNLTQINLDSAAVSASGTFTSSSTSSGSTFTTTGTGGSYYVTTRSGWLSTADKLFQIENQAANTGFEMNVGSATLGTCTGGTITTGSHNFAGGYTGNTSSSCVVNFGAPSWTNAPFCIAMSIASTTHPRVSAVSTSSMTITGGVSGEAITYHCSGRIGV